MDLLIKLHPKFLPITKNNPPNVCVLISKKKRFIIVSGGTP
jgi:hypothetical protein